MDAFAVFPRRGQRKWCALTTSSPKEETGFALAHLDVGVVVVTEMIEGSWERAYRDYATSGKLAKLCCACAHSKRKLEESGAKSHEIERYQRQLRRAVPGYLWILHYVFFCFVL